MEQAEKASEFALYGSIVGLLDGLGDHVREVDYHWGGASQKRFQGGVPQESFSAIVRLEAELSPARQGLLLT